MPKEGKARVLSEAEFKRLLIVAKDGQFAIRNSALVYCSFGLGLRVKEIASLTIADVADYNYQLLEEICLKRSMTKGEKQRYAYLANEKIRKALQAHLDTLQHVARDKPFFRPNVKVALRLIVCKNGSSHSMIRQELLEQVLILVDVLSLPA